MFPKICLLQAGFIVCVFMLGVSTALAANFDCPPIVSVQGDMGIKTRYLNRHEDPTFSTLVPELVEEQAKVREQVNYPAKKIINLGALYLKQRSDPNIRACLLRHVDAVAEMKYLQGSSAEDMVYKSWLLSAITITLLKLDDAGLGLTANDAAFRQWATWRAQEIAEHYQQEGCNYNHCYWGGVAAAAVGRYTANADLSDFSRWTLKRAQSNIDGEGFLPAELHRGKRSFHYTVFATAALISQIALLGEDTTDTWLANLTSQACASTTDLESKGNFKNLGKQDVTGSAPYLYLLKAYHPQQCANSTRTLQGEPYVFFLGGDLGYINDLTEHASAAAVR